jgi:hypothetical protein
MIVLGFVGGAAAHGTDHRHRRLRARRRRPSRRAINPMLPAQRWCYGKQRDSEQASKVSHAKRQFDEVTG